MREDKEEVPQQIITWHSLHKEAGEEEITLKEEEIITLIPEEED